MGRSDLLVRIFFIEKVLGIIIIFATMPFGVLLIAFGMLFTSVITTFIHLAPLRESLSYSFTEFFEDIKQPVLLTLIMGGVIYPIKLITMPSMTILGLQVFTGIVIYIVVSFAIKSDLLEYLLDIAITKTRWKFLSTIKSCMALDTALSK